MARVTPSQEHLEYLQRIGVDILTPSNASAAAGAVPQAPDSATPAADLAIGARRLPMLWTKRRLLVLALSILLLLAAVAVAVWIFAAEPAAAAEPTPTPAPGVLPAGTSLDMFVHGKREPKVTPALPATSSASTSGDASRAPMPEQAQGPRAESGKEKAGSPSNGAAPRRVESAAATTSKAVQPWSLEALGIFALVALVGATLFCQGHLDGRVRRLEVTLHGTAQKEPHETNAAVPLHTAPPPNSDPAELYAAGSPATALEALVAVASARGLSPLPRPPVAAGIASVAGNVRPENQDAAVAFEVGYTQVIVVGDGLGGLPRGQEAARLAVGRAALSAATSLAETPGAPSFPQLVAGRALLDAAAALGGQALTAGYGTGRDGFRTTLIVVVATPETYGYAYIGDGGGVVQRSSGATETFVVPQKSGGIANVVSGSLGPMLQGSPAVGLVARKPGDVLLVGSDGVFDRVPDTFAATVSQALDAHGGDAQRVASLAVTDLAAATDSTGYICDDNLTFGILCTPVVDVVADRRRRVSAGRG